jgi:hypothetical protein
MKTKQKIILVRGTCGAGKSYWINQQLKEHEQVIDFSKMLDMDWQLRPAAAVKMIDPNAKTVYIEAIFGLGSPSYLDIVDRLKLLKVKVFQVLVHRSYEDCKAGIKQGDPDKAEKRIEILDKYWGTFDDVKSQSGKISKVF